MPGHGENSLTDGVVMFGEGLSVQPFQSPELGTGHRSTQTRLNPKAFLVEDARHDPSPKAGLL